MCTACSWFLVAGHCLEVAGLDDASLVVEFLQVLSAGAQLLVEFIRHVQDT